MRARARIRESTRWRERSSRIMRPSGYASFIPVHSCRTVGEAGSGLSNCPSPVEAQRTAVSAREGPPLTPLSLERFLVVILFFIKRFEIFHDSLSENCDSEVFTAGFASRHIEFVRNLAKFTEVLDRLNEFNR